MKRIAVAAVLLLALVPAARTLTHHSTRVRTTPTAAALTVPGLPVVYDDATPTTAVPVLPAANVAQPPVTVAHAHAAKPVVHLAPAVQIAAAQPEAIAHPSTVEPAPTSGPSLDGTNCVDNGCETADDVHGYRNINPSSPAYGYCTRSGAHEMQPSVDDGTYKRDPSCDSYDATK